jgi:hypothetical protein
MSSKLVAIPIFLLLVLQLFVSGMAVHAEKTQRDSETWIGNQGISGASPPRRLRESSRWKPSNLTTDEHVVLMTLCRLAIEANGGLWQSARINAAITLLAFGYEPPDNLQANAYKICMTAGRMDEKSPYEKQTR